MTRALTGPAAAALPPRIVAGEDLLAANSLLGATGAAGQILGPLAASVTLAATGFRAVFLLDAASYLAGACAVVLLPGRPGPAPPGSPQRLAAAGSPAGFRGGLAAAGRQPAVRMLLALGVAVTFTSAAFLVVEPLYAGRVLGRPPAQFALFEAVAGAGAVLASLVMSRRLPRWLPARARRVGGGHREAHPGLRAPALAACGYGLSAVVFAGTPWIPVAYAGAFAWGSAVPYSP